MKLSKFLEKLSYAITNSKDDIDLNNEQAEKLVNEIITTDEAFLKLLENNTSVKKNNMKISELLKIDPSLDIDVASDEFISKYIVNVEETTNGLLNFSKLIGTMLAFYPKESISSKEIHDIAEKLLK